MVNRYPPWKDQEAPKHYSSFDDWVAGELPNRKTLRAMFRKAGLAGGVRGKGGGLSTSQAYARQATARRDLQVRAREVMSDLDRRHTAEAALLAALEEEIG